MKKIITLGLIVLGANLMAQVPSYVPTSGLSGWWSFTGNANDASVNSNNGVVSGTTLTTDRFGNANSAYSFDGTSSYIVVNDAVPLRLNNTDYSVSVWINEVLLVSSEHQVIISKRDPFINSAGWLLYLDVLTNPMGEVGFAVSGGGDPTAYSQSAMQLNTWTHIVEVYKSGSNVMRTYINGILNDTTLSIPTPNGTTNKNLFIGSDGLANQYYFNGKIDDIGIWNRALTQQEVTNLYDAQNTATTTLCFSSGTNYGVNSSPYVGTSADFNGDGKIDLATPNVNTNDVSVLLGTGTGSFGAATNFATGAYPASVTNADFNGDGKVDLATGDNGAGTVSVLLGTGTGSFGSPTNFSVGSTPLSIISTDFNGDGKKDLALVNSSLNRVSILLGTGTGSFGAVTSFTVGTQPNAVISADFNGDGKKDLAVANYASNNVSVLLGTGTGNFGTAINFTAGTGPYAVVSVDFNGDAKLDLAVVNGTSNDVSVLLGTGTGSFGTATNFVAGNHSAWITSADFNGDGNSDLATSNNTSNDVSVLLGTGTGSFGTATHYTVGTGPISIISADFNGDTKPDLATTNFSSNNVSVLLNCNTNCPSLLSGLVARYDFSGNANDLSGTGNNGTVYGPTLTTDRFGIANKAYNFVNGADKIVVPNNNSLSLTGSFGFNFWLDISGFSGTFNSVLSKYESSSCNHYGYFIGMMSWTGEDKIEYQADPICSSANSYEPNANGKLNASQWYNVGITYDKPNTKLIYYVNGVKIDSFVVALTVQNTAYDLIIGNHVAYPYTSSSTGANFQGKLDDIRIYNRLLTKCDMDSLYTPNLTTGVANQNSKPQIKIYPNPANEQITIQGISKEARVEIYNVSGQLVKSIQSPSTSIDISQLEKGFYFLKVTSEGKSQTLKFVKD
jgi:hypothetical protein